MGWRVLGKRDLTGASADDVRDKKVESEVTQIEKTKKASHGLDYFRESL